MWLKTRSKWNTQYSGTFTHIVLIHEEYRAGFEFWNTVLFIPGILLKHHLIFMVPLWNNLCIHGMILWWIYADQFYIRDNSFCSSKLSFLLGSRENTFLWSSVVHPSKWVSDSSIYARNTPAFSYDVYHFFLPSH